MDRQPYPKRGGTDIFPDVIADIEERAEMGKAQYGTYLQTHNGRNAMQDAYEELLDLACYMKQHLTEVEDWRKRALIAEEHVKLLERVCQINGWPDLSE